MQTSQLPENDGEKQPAAADSQQKEKRAGGALTEFGPVAFFQKLLSGYQERYAARHKQWCNQYITQPTLAGRRYLYAHWTRRVQLVALAFGAMIFLFLWSDNRIDSNTVVAIFTIVLTYATWFSWQAMREQNTIMVKQMGQTDKMIDHMRAEQRPWLSIVDAKVDDIAVNRPVTLRYRISNDGPSPGTVHCLAVRAGFVADLKNPDLNDALASQWLVAMSCANVVPPKGGCGQQYSQGVISAEQVDELAAGRKWLTLIGVLYYTGPSGDQYETGFAFACKADGILRVIGAPDVNYMK